MTVVSMQELLEDYGPLAQDPPLHVSESGELREVLDSVGIRAVVRRSEARSRFSMAFESVPDMVSFLVGLGVWDEEDDFASALSKGAAMRGVVKPEIHFTGVELVP